MARKNMWSATAAVGDAELRGIPEGYAPEADGTIEFPRAMPGPSSNVYSVGRLGGAHRRSDRKPGDRPTGRASVRPAANNDDEWTSIWPDETPTVQRPSPVDDRRGYPGDPGPSGYDRSTASYERGPSGYDSGPSGYDRGPAGGYDRGPSGYDRGPSAYDTGTWDTISRPDVYPSSGGYPTTGYPTSGYPSSGSRSVSGARSVSAPRPTSGARATEGSGRRGGSRRRPSRPMRYTGARRKFSSWAPLGGGVLMLALVLGATMLAESDRYTDSTSSPPASAPAAASNPTAQAGPPDQLADQAAANAVATAINQQLDQLGCGRVTVDQSLITAAGTQVEDMLDKGYFSTTGPDGGTTLQRAQTAGYKGTKVVESVVSGAGNPAEAAQAAFPVADAAKAPATVKVVSGGQLTCGWTAVGAEARMNDKSVAYWSIVLGQ